MLDVRRMQGARKTAAALAQTMDYALRVLLAIVGQVQDTRGISPIEAALCRQHLADVVESMVVWCDHPAPLTVSCEAKLGLIPVPAVRRLLVTHHADSAAYRATLVRLAAQLREGPLQAIPVEAWVLLEEIADGLATAWPARHATLCDG